MYLELADNGTYLAAGAVCTCPNGFTGYCASGNCDRCCQGMTAPRSLSEDVPPQELYVFVPTDMEGGGKWVREDYFDRFDDTTYNRIMDALEPYQQPGVNGIFSRMREKRDQRRERRQARKDRRVQSKATAREQRSAGGGIVGKLVEGARDIFGGQRVDAGFDITSGQQPTGYFRSETERAWYENPVVIIGGLALVGGTIYLATRKRK